MKVEIKYCTSWGYEPKAASLADELKSKYGDDLEAADLVPSSGGAFEVSLDGDLIYSKLKTGRFPVVKEVTDAIDAIMK